MLSWIGKRVVRHNMARLNAGDLKPTLRMDARKVKMVFPGDSSWAPGARGKKEHRAWLERFARVDRKSVV